MPTSPTGQHVPLEKFKQNLKDIIGHEAVKPHQPTVILITPPPVDEYALELRDLLKGSTGVTRTAEHTKKYADACRDVGSEMGSTVVDLWTAIMARAGWQAGDALPGSKTVPRNQVLRDVLRDGKSTNSANPHSAYSFAGLHFSPQGYEVLFEELMRMIQIALPEYGPQTIPDRFPCYKEAPM